MASFMRYNVVPSGRVSKKIKKKVWGDAIKLAGVNHKTCFCVMHAQFAHMTLCTCQT